MFLEPQMKVIEYCAEEVARQYGYFGTSSADAAHAVGWMLNAWNEASIDKKQGLALDVDRIEGWGKLVEPKVNRHGFRTVRVFVGDHEGAPPAEVRARMDRMVRNLNMMTPHEAYMEFQVIHPFGDGNGRVGKLIYWWLMDQMLTPTHDGFPNPHGIANP